MSKGIAGKNNWALFLLLLAGIVLGGFIGSLAAGVPFLSWLELWADIWICKSNRAGSWNPGHYIRTQYQDYDRKHYWCINRNYYLSVFIKNKSLKCRCRWGACIF